MSVTKIFTITVIVSFTTILATKTIKSHESTPRTTKAPNCTSVGLSCYDCWTSMNCTDPGDGQLVPELIPCAEGTSCRNNNGTCQSRAYYDCNNSDKFRCQDEGMFPDPYDAKKYHICIRDNSNWVRFERQCEGIFLYDSYKKQCSKRMDERPEYTSPVPICTFEGQKSQLLDNRYMYYECFREEVENGFNFVPQLYSCKDNYVFFGTDCQVSTPNYVDDDGICFNNTYYAHPSHGCPCCNMYGIICYEGQPPKDTRCIPHAWWDPISQCKYFTREECHSH